MGGVQYKGEMERGTDGEEEVVERQTDRQQRWVAERWQMADELVLGCVLRFVSCRASWTLLQRRAGWVRVSCLSVLYICTYFSCVCESHTFVLRRVEDSWPAILICVFVCFAAQL